MSHIGFSAGVLLSVRKFLSWKIKCFSVRFILLPSSLTFTAYRKRAHRDKFENLGHQLEELKCRNVFFDDSIYKFRRYC